MKPVSDNISTKRRRMKKIQNPERYISRLKTEIECLKKSREFWEQTVKERNAELSDLKKSALGQYLTEYQAGIRRTLSYGKERLDSRCEVGKYVTVTGRIAEIKRSSIGNNEVTFELGKIYIKD